MGAHDAMFGLLLDAIAKVQSFIVVFTTIYTLVILAYIIMQWIRLPYSSVGTRVQRFLYDVCEPYLRLFRRFLPRLGPLDLSPMVGVFVLIVIQRVLIALLNKL